MSGPETRESAAQRVPAGKLGQEQESLSILGGVPAGIGMKGGPVGPLSRGPVPSRPGGFLTAAGTVGCPVFVCWPWRTAAAEWTDCRWSDA